MLKVTADTNILVSAVIAEGNEFKLLELAKEGKIKLILSPAILLEFKNVISREKFGFSQKQIISILKQIISICEMVVPALKVDAIKDDPIDNMVLECAEAGKAEYIVSGDEHLLKLKEYKGIKIVTTQEILKKT